VIAITASVVGPEKRAVYVLRSERSDRPYVGVTSDVRQRLETHNAGGSAYTAAHRPWRLVVVLEFPDEQRAIAFERYLKSGSGRAFAKRHFV
jgi:putative endonuclease